MTLAPLAILTNPQVAHTTSLGGDQSNAKAYVATASNTVGMIAGAVLAIVVVGAMVGSALLMRHKESAVSVKTSTAEPLTFATLRKTMKMSTMKARKAATDVLETLELQVTDVEPKSGSLTQILSASEAHAFNKLVPLTCQAVRAVDEQLLIRQVEIMWQLRQVNEVVRVYGFVRVNKTLYCKAY